MLLQHRVRKESQGGINRRKKFGKDPRIEESRGIEHMPSVHSLIGRRQTNSIYNGEESPIFYSQIPIQAKLSIGKPNDKYEHEADRVADKVMRMSDTDVAQRAESGTVQPMRIQQILPACDEELQRQPDEEKEETLQAKKVPGQTPQVGSGVEARINNLKSGGIPLDASTRNFFEPRFGHDFSNVRVHHDGEAASISRSINARAFTLGNHMVFGSGEYQPQSSEGKRLFGHELTHVVQQRGGWENTRSPLPCSGVTGAGKSLVSVADGLRPNVSGKQLFSRQLIRMSLYESGGQGGMVQRYEGFEHRDIGDRHLAELQEFLKNEEIAVVWAQSLGLRRDELLAAMREDTTVRDGIKVQSAPFLDPETGHYQTRTATVTPGEVIALMGDFFETPEELIAAVTSAPDSKTEKTKTEQILDVMEQERSGSINLGEATQQYEELTGGGYLRLAQRNREHFSAIEPVTLSGTPVLSNRNAWRRLHGQALSAAARAREAHDADGLQRALLLDAAAGHFLTDAFAAGHMFDKNRVVAQIQLHLQANTVRTQNPEMQAYVGIVSAAGALHQIVLKNIHDRMNRDGFTATNSHGVSWRSFGDDSLDRSPDTQRLAALAVFLSRLQVRKTYQGETVDPEEVVAIMPDDATVRRATDYAIALIPLAANEVQSLMYRGRGVLPLQFGPVLGSILESNITTIGAPGREQELERMREAAERIGSGPLLAPSFTLGRW